RLAETLGPAAHSLALPPAGGEAVEQQLERGLGVARRHDRTFVADGAVLAVVAAQIDLVVRRVAAVDLLAHAAEAEIADMVQAAAVLAAGDAHLDVGQRRVAAQQIGDLLAEALAVRDADAAAGRAGARHEVGRVAEPFLHR